MLLTALLGGPEYIQQVLLWMKITDSWPVTLHEFRETTVKLTHGSFTQLNLNLSSCTFQTFVLAIWHRQHGMSWSSHLCRVLQWEQGTTYLGAKYRKNSKFKNHQVEQEMLLVILKKIYENNASLKFFYRSFCVLTDRLEIKNFQSWSFQWKQKDCQ